MIRFNNLKTLFILNYVTVKDIYLRQVLFVYLKFTNNKEIKKSILYDYNQCYSFLLLIMSLLKKYLSPTHCVVEIKCYKFVKELTINSQYVGHPSYLYSPSSRFTALIVKSFRILDTQRI